jgi:hypothetical protein
MAVIHKVEDPVKEGGLLCNFGIKDPVAPLLAGQEYSTCIPRQIYPILSIKSTCHNWLCIKGYTFIPRARSFLKILLRWWKGFGKISQLKFYRNTL